MASRRTLSQQIGLAAGMILICAGLVMLPGQQNAPASLVTAFLSTAVWRGVGLLPSVVPTVLQALQNQALESAWVCPFGRLVSCLPLVFFLA